VKKTVGMEKEQKFPSVQPSAEEVGYEELPEDEKEHQEEQPEEDPSC
jgi:hypothetical protein